MEQFCSLLCCWGRYSFDESKMDIVTSLPLELAVMILRLLDPRALMAALSVNRKWLRIVRSDSILRSRVRTELRAQRLAQVQLRVGERSRAGVAMLDERRSIFSKKSKNVRGDKEGGRVPQLASLKPNVVQRLIAPSVFARPMRPTANARIGRDVNGIPATSSKFEVASRRPQPYSLRSSSKTLTKVKTSNLRL